MGIERASGELSFVDVLDRVLDKGIVIDGWMRFALMGIDLVTVEGMLSLLPRNLYEAVRAVSTSSSPSPACPPEEESERRREESTLATLAVRIARGLSGSARRLGFLPPARLPTQRETRMTSREKYANFLITSEWPSCWSPTTMVFTPRGLPLSPRRSTISARSTCWLPNASRALCGHALTLHRPLRCSRGAIAGTPSTARRPTASTSACSASCPSGRR